MIYLINDILESIEKIEEYVDNLSKEEFDINTLIQDAVFRRLMIIGEAVKNISLEVKENNPEIPWKNVAGMRDVIIHQYAGVKLKKVWSVIRKGSSNFKNKYSENKRRLKQKFNSYFVDGLHTQQKQPRKH